MNSKEEWLNAQRVERDWHGNCINSSDEEFKQLHYAEYMGLDQFNVYDKEKRFGGKFDLQGKSVLDVGGGPVSLLLKCVNFRRAVVVDPLEWPEWVMERYRSAGIEYVQEMAEDMAFDEVFDEVWIYNVLQHVHDPSAVIRKALEHGRLIRAFEWVDTVKNDGHPHILTKEFLDREFGAEGQQLDLGWRGYQVPSYALVMEVEKDKPARRNEQPDSDITVAVSTRRYRNHGDFLATLIGELNFKTIAEVGVLQGVTSLEVLSRCPTVTNYYLIDPWKEYPESQRDPKYDYWRQDYWDKVYAEVVVAMLPYKDKVHVWRMPSAEASKLIEDGSLDLVFIDAFHDYASVYQQLTEWTPKVKETGIIAGHDWWDEGEWAEKYADERKALKDFFGPEVIQMGTPAANWGGVWFIRKRDCLEKNLKPKVILNEQPDSDITVTVTSTGRADLLRKTVRSLLKTIGRPVKVIISDDSGDGKQQKAIIKSFGHKFDLYLHNGSRGQAWNLDFLYGKAGTPYIFHCEDDWEFLKGGYIEKSLDVLGERPDVAVVGLVKDEEFEKMGAVGERHETRNGTVYYDHPMWRIDDKHDWWHGWIGSPHLLRRRDYLELGGFQQAGTEADFDKKVFAQSGMKSVWLEDQYARHIGGDRSTFEPGKPHVWVKKEESGFRFHLLGLAHVPTHYENSFCAYSQKVLKLAKMLKDLGHTVYFYGSEGSEVECDEFVQVVSHADRIAQYGDYDWRKEFFKWDTTGQDMIHQKFNRNAIAAIKERGRPRDFLLCTMGTNHKPIADVMNDMAAVETGIGYRGVFSKYKVFESYTWMHYIYGILHGQGWKGYNDGGWYDCVIPNYFDPADFPFEPNKDDYFLYIGRLIRRKGLDIACQVSRDLGKRLIVAGQGDLVNSVEGLNITKDNFPNVEHIGAVGPEERKELMGKARLAFAPTYYIEPFGGVAVELQMCGTPVLTTDWGAFSETCLHAVTGYRCRTYDDFIWAAKNIDKIDPQDCRDWAVRNYSMDRIALMYEDYFSKIYDLWLDPREVKDKSGWYRVHEDRRDLDWLRKWYPKGACCDG